LIAIIFLAASSSSGSTTAVYLHVYVTYFGQSPKYSAGAQFTKKS